MNATDLIIYCLLFSPTPLDDRGLFEATCDAGGSAAPTKRDLARMLCDLIARGVVEMDEHDRYHIAKYDSHEVVHMLTRYLVLRHHSEVTMAKTFDLATRRMRGVGG